MSDTLYILQDLNSPVSFTSPDHDSATITPAELAEVGMKLAKENKDEDPKRWTFGGLTRDADDKFDDVALAEILKNATEEPAHAFGANGSPPALKVVEVIGQLMAREWQVCTMNEFRTYLNLKPFKSFTVSFVSLLFPLV